MFSFLDDGWSIVGLQRTISRCVAAFAAIFLLGIAECPGGTIAEDAVNAAEWVAKAMKSSGYNADFTIQSLKEVDRFIRENAADGEPTKGGLLEEDTGPRLWALGAYVGEVIRRHSSGRWVGVDDNPSAEFNIELQFDDGGRIWPMQRVLNRFQLGDDESLYFYGYAIIEDYK